MELFACFSDDTRRAIVRELADAHRESPEDPALAFSDLRRRVGARDSSNFNYHLGKLGDRYVRETDDGYRPTLLGLRVAALLREADADQTAVDVPTDVTCLCGDPTTARHADGVFVWECESDHENRILLPDAAREGRDLADLHSLAVSVAHDWLDQIAGGYCPVCYGAIDLTFFEDDGWCASPMFAAPCEGCGSNLTVPVAAPALDHPTVLAFYADHGIDRRSTQPMELGLLRTAPEREDWGATVTTTLKDETLSVAVTTDGCVERVERR